MKLLSNCCNATYSIVGEKYGTSYFSCSKCGYPCDVHEEIPVFHSRVYAPKENKPESWEDRFDKQFLLPRNNPDYCSGEKIKSFIRSLILEERKEARAAFKSKVLEEAIPSVGHGVDKSFDDGFDSAVKCIADYIKELGIEEKEKGK